MLKLLSILSLLFVLTTFIKAEYETDDDVPNETFEEFWLKNNLKPISYHVTQMKGTERAFHGKYFDIFDEGKYDCVVCKKPLFLSEHKYEAKTGWPSFYKAHGKVKLQQDDPENMEDMFKTETRVKCDNCYAHLGYIFTDGPKEHGGIRYCINSAGLNFVKATKVIQ